MYYKLPSDIVFKQKKLLKEQNTEHDVHKLQGTIFVLRYDQGAIPTVPNPTHH